LPTVSLACAIWAASHVCVAAFDLQGHRGTRGLAPENTLAAFRTALDLGVTTLETDLAVTKDDVLVISHDPMLNPDLVRGPDGKWIGAAGPPIRSLSLAELKRFDIGRLNPGRRRTLPHANGVFRHGGPGCALQHRDQDRPGQA
jgi:glycerophosphoryl diester phosphodiesterase